MTGARLLVVGSPSWRLARPVFDWLRSQRQEGVPLTVVHGNGGQLNHLAEFWALVCDPSHRVTSEPVPYTHIPGLTATDEPLAHVRQMLATGIDRCGVFAVPCAHPECRHRGDDPGHLEHTARAAATTARDSGVPVDVITTHTSDRSARP